MSTFTVVYIVGGLTVGVAICVIFGCIMWKSGTCGGGGGGYSTGSYVVQAPDANYNYTVSRSTRAYYNNDEDEAKRQAKKDEKYRRQEEIREKYNSAEQQARRAHMAACAASGLSGDFREDKNGLLY